MKLIQLIEDWDELPLTVDAQPKDRPLYDQEDKEKFWEEVTTPLTEEEARQKEFDNLTPEEQEEVLFCDRSYSHLF